MSDQKPQQGLVLSRFTGIAFSSDQFDPAEGRRGQAAEQVNVNSVDEGRLQVRRGVKIVSFDSGTG